MKLAKEVHLGQSSRAMYLPKTFEETNLTRIREFIEAHAFGMLIVPDRSGGVEIAHLPFLPDWRAGARGVLRAHVARANPIWRLAEDGRPATVVFSGPHGYVSPRWYEYPLEHVPTWNYMAVHASGSIVAPSHPLTSSVIDELSAFHEGSAPDAWRMSGLRESLREELLAAIVGLDVSIDRLEAKFKLSQNRSSEDRVRVLRALDSRGTSDDLEMAKGMKRGLT